MACPTVPPIAKASERSHHRRVLQSLVPHGRGAEDLHGAGCGGVCALPAGARERALQPRAGLSLCEGEEAGPEGAHTVPLLEALPGRGNPTARGLRLGGKRRPPGSGLMEPQNG